MKTWPQPLLPTILALAVALNRPVDARSDERAVNVATGHTHAAITVMAGGLPIILSAPHGGRAAVPCVPERKGEGATRFNARSDANTDILADKLANAIAAFAKSHLPAAEQAPAASDASPRTGKIAVGVYLDEGAGPSVNDLLRALETFEQVSVTKLTAEQIRSGGLAGLDILMCPGGSGSTQGRNLDESGREKIRAFVREGGGFIGICAGAYLATAHYAWSLNLLDAKVIDTQHWNRGKGTVDIELTPAGREVLRTTNQRLPIHYAQGPLLAPADRPEIENYEEMANFKTEIVKNGAPAGVMIGTTSIARGRFGQGRVICFSPHPEMTAGLESFVQDAIDYTSRKGTGKWSK